MATEAHSPWNTQFITPFTAQSCSSEFIKEDKHNSACLLQPESRPYFSEEELDLNFTFFLIQSAHSLAIAFETIDFST